MCCFHCLNSIWFAQTLPLKIASSVGVVTVEVPAGSGLELVDLPELDCDEVEVSMKILCESFLKAMLVATMSIGSSILFAFYQW